MRVDPDEAQRRNLSRFVITGRIVPPTYLASIGDKPGATYEELKNGKAADNFAEIDNG
jgi:hypothetical protein